MYASCAVTRSALVRPWHLSFCISQPALLAANQLYQAAINYPVEDVDQHRAMDVPRVTLELLQRQRPGGQRGAPQVLDGRASGHHPAGSHAMTLGVRISHVVLG